MRSATVLGFVASAAAAALATPSGLPQPLGELGWEGVITPGGPKVEVWGSSFEDIQAKIQVEHPKFSIYTHEEQAAPETSADPAVVARSKLERRWGRRVCDNRFGVVMPYFAEQAANNLRRINGNSCKARARTCIRTQCVGGAAIGICNDNHHQIDVPCTGVADMARHIYQNCWELDTDCKAGRGCEGSNHVTFGQLFSDHHTWNVIVGQCGYFGNGERPVKA
ncbi:uncharacterized protein CTRU02_201256 [Colletotrichum truncatum]|uniref:Secreted protein n=1 Tax=Colletotrichum truncatum TaxID=5467 RepID=A0ACC3ZGX2_COLTU|nr:uncharacterized protein CTRU02_08046 [Colletotrichum truncatum]KAF6790526.1 secreted protein [Colletotrichum truncatum]